MNAVIYSNYCIGDDPNENQAYLEILYSIKTLRRHSKLPVKVYLTPAGIMDRIKPELDVRQFADVEVVYFNNDVQTLYPTYVQWGFAQLLDHRWRNALDSLQRFNFDRILFLDGDTIIHGPLESLFRLYPDVNKLWTRTDVTPHISQPLGLQHGMNDGQFILSREVANKLRPNFYQKMQQMIAKLLKRAETILNPELHRHLHWLSVQYCVYQMCDELKIEVGDFSKLHVLLSTEPSYLHREKNCKPSHLLHHYFSGNMHRYLPKEYWSTAKKKSNEKLLNGLSLCSCGYLK